jgi:hypothetical protein
MKKDVDQGGDGPRCVYKGTYKTFGWFLIFFFSTFKKAQFFFPIFCFVLRLSPFSLFYPSTWSLCCRVSSVVVVVVVVVKSKRSGGDSFWDPLLVLTCDRVTLSGRLFYATGWNARFIPPTVVSLFLLLADPHSISLSLDLILDLILSLLSLSLYLIINSWHPT